MKYLERYLQSELPSVLSAPGTEDFRFSEEEEEEEKKSIFKADTTDKADRSPLSSALSVPGTSVGSVSACSECGSNTWTVSLVDETGHRVCHDCITGMTALRANGVPI